MSVITELIQTSDGRTLGVESYGDPTHPALIFLSGTYEGRTIYPGMIDAADREGLFVIGYDRPGYGASTPRPGRRISDCADDLLAIAQHFGITRLFTIGFSGGGSHSIASAVLLPELVNAAVAFCPLQPYAPAMEEKSDAVEFDEQSVREYANKERDQILATTDLQARLDNNAFPEKQRVSDAFLDFHYRSMKQALEPGVAGCADDLLAYYNSWGLDLNTNRVPIKIWQGKADVTVPYIHGEWLAANTPRTEIHLTDEDSHRSIFENYFEAALEWLMTYR